MQSRFAYPSGSPLSLRILIARSCLLESPRRRSQAIDDLLRFGNRVIEVDREGQEVWESREERFKPYVAERRVVREFDRKGDEVRRIAIVRGGGTVHVY